MSRLTRLTADSIIFRGLLLAAVILLLSAPAALAQSAIAGVVHDA